MTDAEHFVERLLALRVPGAPTADERAHYRQVALTSR